MGKKMRHRYLFVFMITMLFRGCSHTPRDDVLLVGTVSSFRPFSFKQDGELVGFDIDVVKAVAQELGKKIVFKDMAFDALIPQAQLGMIHVVAAGMTPTSSRRKKVFFATPHMKGDTLMIVTLKDEADITSIDDLKRGKKVLVNQGYTADLYMSTLDGIDEIIRLETPAEALLALQHKRAHAFVTAKNPLIPFFEKHDPTAYRVLPIEGVHEDIALIVSKSFPALYDEIQKALIALEQNGSLQRIKQKWHIYD